MKQFEIGKRYKVRPYSYTKDGRRDFNNPVTMTIISRTDWYIRAEMKWANHTREQSFRVSKRMTDAEQIDYCGRIITANHEVYEEKEENMEYKNDDVLSRLPQKVAKHIEHLKHYGKMYKAENHNGLVMQNKNILRGYIICLRDCGMIEDDELKPMIERFVERW